MNHYEVCTACGVLHDKTLGVAVNPQTKGHDYASIREMAHRGVCQGCLDFKAANERIAASTYEASAPVSESKLPISKVSGSGA
jgi:hypothetical protein